LICEQLAIVFIQLVSFLFVFSSYIGAMEMVPVVGQNVIIKIFGVSIFILGQS